LAGAILPLNVKRGSQDSVVFLGQRGVAALMEVQEAGLSGLQNSVSSDSRSHRHHGRHVATLGANHLGVRNRGADALEGVSVLAHGTLGVGDHHAVPAVLEQLHRDLLDLVRVGLEEMLANDDAKAFNGAKIMHFSEDVNGVLASVSGDDIRVITSVESAIHNISFKQDISSNLHDVLGTI